MPKAGITYGKKILPPFNFGEIVDTAERETMEAVAYVARPDDKVVRAAEIVRQADADIALHLEERNQAVASLWFYEKRLGLTRTIGVTPTAYREILSKALYRDVSKPIPDVDSNAALTALAREAGVPYVRDAAEKVLDLARIVAAARGRRRVAVRFMQECVLALSEPPYDWSTEKIAEHSGIARSLVYRQRNAARRRHAG